MQASLLKELQNEKQLYTGRRRKKDGALAKCRLGLCAWGPKKPMLCFHAVIDEDGHPLEDEDESDTRMCSYCCKIFESRNEDERHHARIFEHVLKAPDDFQWESDEREFYVTIAAKKESSTGPDGIPKKNLQVRLGSQFLFNAFKLCLRVAFSPHTRTCGPFSFPRLRC